MKNVRGKSHTQQRKMSLKETKGKKPLKESKANLKLPTAMTHANSKFQMGKPMLTVGTLKEAGKSYVVLHEYYINNYKKHQHIIGGFKEKHFLVGEVIFLISWSNLYDLFHPRRVRYLSSALLHIVSPQKLASSIYIYSI
jgi:hypothetical protein